MTLCIKDVLNARCKLLSETINRLKNAYSVYPEGKIWVKHRNNKPYYYYINDDTGCRYLGKKNSYTIEALIQKGYINDVISASELELSLLKNMLNRYPSCVAEDLFNNLPEARKLYAKPIILGDDISVDEWLNAPYDHPGFKADSPKYTTLKGDRVRSKSEMIIADRLWANGIPYKYECPILVGNEILHPDFSILRLSDKKILYHEHCGMVDNPEYAENMVKRIDSYNKEGIYLGDRLFVSMETSKTPLDIEFIDYLIRTHFR